MVGDCDTEGRKSSGIKQTRRHGHGSLVKDKSPRREKSARARTDIKPQQKVAAAAVLLASSNHAQRNCTYDHHRDCCHRISNSYSV